MDHKLSSVPQYMSKIYMTAVHSPDQIRQYVWDVTTEMSIAVIMRDIAASQDNPDNIQIRNWDNQHPIPEQNLYQTAELHATAFQQYQKKRAEFVKRL